MELIPTLVVGVLAFLAAGAGRRLTFVSRQRGDLAEDVATLGKLPKGEARETVSAYVDEQVKTFTQEQKQLRSEAFRVGTFLRFIIVGVMSVAAGAISHMTGDWAPCLPSLSPSLGSLAFIGASSVG